MPITDASSEDEDSTTESAERLSKCARPMLPSLQSWSHDLLEGWTPGDELQ